MRRDSVRFIASSGPIRKMPMMWYNVRKASTCSGMMDEANCSKKSSKTGTIVRIVLEKENCVRAKPLFPQSSRIQLAPARGVVAKR